MRMIDPQSLLHVLLGEKFIDAQTVVAGVESHHVDVAFARQVASAQPPRNSLRELYEIFREYAETIISCGCVWNDAETLHWNGSSVVAQASIESILWTKWSDISASGRVKFVGSNSSNRCGDGLRTSDGVEARCASSFSDANDAEEEVTRRTISWLSLNDIAIATESTQDTKSVCGDDSSCRNPRNQVPDDSWTRR